MSEVALESASAGVVAVVAVNLAPLLLLLSRDCLEAVVVAVILGRSIALLEPAASTTALACGLSVPHLLALFAFFRLLRLRCG